MAEKEQKVERMAKQMQKTKKEVLLELTAANFERMKKGKEKKAEDENKFMYDALNKYHSMIEARDFLI